MMDFSNAGLSPESIHSDLAGTQPLNYRTGSGSDLADMQGSTAHHFLAPMNCGIL